MPETYTTEQVGLAQSGDVFLLDPVNKLVTVEPCGDVSSAELQFQLSGSGKAPAKMDSTILHFLLDNKALLCFLATPHTLI